MRLRRTILAPIALLAALACSREAPPNLLLVTFDTTRADHLSSYGYPAPTSPHVDALAARGARFSRAYTHAPSTLPAHASLLTGLLPPGHGVRANARFRLGEASTTLAEVLRGAGYATGAVVGAMPLDQSFGLGQGFDLYDGDFRSGRERGIWLGHAFSVLERDAADVTDRALAWVAGQRRPWFLFAHYFDPHLGYKEHPGLSDRFPTLYDGEIAHADLHLGRLLDGVDRRGGRTLVVMTADHGEGLGEHGESEHNRYLYDSTLHVPLVFALDGVVRAGAVLDTPVGHVDVLPSVLDLLGLPPLPNAAGRSLAPALRDGVEPAALPVYGETLEWTFGIDEGIQVRALIDGPWKLIRSDVRDDDGGFAVLELYDRATDPAEVKDQARHDEPRRERLAEELKRWSRRLEATAVEAETYDLDPETVKAFRSLGYLR